MQKISTSLKKTDLIAGKKKNENSAPLQPSAGSLQKILQFAASYRAQRVDNNQFVEWFLN